MRSFTPLRLSAQVCFASGLLCAIPVFRGNWGMFALLAALTLLSCFVAVRVSRAGVRLLLGLLPLAALSLASGTAGLAACAVLTGYVAANLASGRFGQEVWRYRKEAGLTLILCAVAALLVLVYPALYNMPSCIFICVCAMETVAALRSLRIGSGHHSSWELRNHAAFLATLTLGAGFGLLGTPLLKKLFLLVGTILEGILMLMSLVLSGVTSLFIEETEATETTAETVTTTVETTWVPDPAHTDLPTGDGWNFSIHVDLPWKWIAFGLAVVALLLLVVWLYRRSAKLEKAKPPEELYHTEKSGSGAASSRRQRKARGESLTRNRRRIRAAYRDYLGYLRRNKVVIRKSDTTAEITTLSKAELQKSDEILRGIYRTARYSDEEPDDAAVAAAEAALAVLTAKPKERPGQKTE